MQGLHYMFPFLVNPEHIRGNTTDCWHIPSTCSTQNVLCQSTQQTCQCDHLHATCKLKHYFRWGGFIVKISCSTSQTTAGSLRHHAHLTPVVVLRLAGQCPAQKPLQLWQKGCCQHLMLAGWLGAWVAQAALLWLEPRQALLHSGGTR